MHISNMSERKCDGHGCGHFGAPRGSRKHAGVDLACSPGAQVCSPIAGKVTKVGYPYGDDLSFRYVEVSTGGYRFRVFYVEPSVAVGDEVSSSTVIGRSQRLGRRYQGITEHVHFEIKNSEGEFVDPTPVMIALQLTRF